MTLLEVLLLLISIFLRILPCFMERFAILVRDGMIVGSISLSSLVGIMSFSHVFVGISLISLSRSFSGIFVNDLSTGVSLGGTMY